MSADTRARRAGGWLAAVVLMLSGCSGGDKGPGPAPAAPAGGPDAEVAAERAKLAPDDGALVDAQEWCAVSTGSRLGSMGPPLRLLVKDQPVFICCKACQRKALADPDKTLATVAGLKVRAKAGKE